MIFLESLFVYKMQEEQDIRWHTRRHAHNKDQYEIHYGIQGQGSLKMGDRQFSLGPGTLAIVPPETEHGVVFHNSGFALSYYAILFQPDSEDTELLEQIERLSIANRTFTLKDNYRFFFEELRIRGHSEKKSLQKVAQHQLAMLLYLLEEEQVPAHGGDARIDKALKIMQNHMYRNLSLEELSAKLGITAPYCIKLFKERMGITPMKYFVQLKIETAGALLESTNRSLIEIAEDLGFYSEFHFSRVFKQYTGEAPSHYRQRCQTPLPPHYGVDSDS